MRVIGLTGGIASGKSTVARLLALRGAEVIDADRVARDVVEPGRPAFADIVREFGTEVLAPDGTLDRKKLGAIVFADESKRRTLNAITHPRIGAETAARVQAAGARGVDVVVYEATLLVENGIHRGLDGLIVVAASPAVQERRVMARDGLGLDEARARIAAQLPLADKIAVADWVIHNDGDPGELASQVDAVWAAVKAGRKGG